MGLPTPEETVQTLQHSLHAKAKAEPGFRFYTLWDKVYRSDILWTAYRQCRRNGGSHGVDAESFKDIETQGEANWLGKLQQELRTGHYRPQPLRRVWIPKANGQQRPLGIPCIRDRVVQTAMVLVLTPIFEADLGPQQYGFRPGLDAKMALRRVYYHVTQYGRREVVDGDLKDYFTSIPHGDLMKCVSRRVADGHVLNVIKLWLEVPVIERTRRGEQRSTQAKDTHRGTPQGGVVSPLLANLYFRRFLLAWRQFGYERTLNARVVNYADDFVICCPPGRAEVAMQRMRDLMARLGLEVNEAKTRIVCLPQGAFDFLGYTFGRGFDKEGRAYIGTRPSLKALKRLRRRIHEETTIRTTWRGASDQIATLNRLLRGWTGYFNQGPVLKSYEFIRRYTERRLRRWLVKKHKQRGTGYRRYPDEFLYGELGLYALPRRRADLPNAKA